MCTPSSKAGSGGALASIFGPSKLEYELLGAGLQAIRFTLKSGDVVIGEAGCLLFLDEGVVFESRMGDGSQLAEETQNAAGFTGILGKIVQGFKRVISNESLFFTWFTNKADVPRVLSVAAPMMGTIVPLDLHRYPQSMIFAQSSAFLCASRGVQFSIELVKRFGTGLFGGEGFILQKMIAESGSPGQLFIHGAGTIVRKELDNEELTMDPGTLMAFTSGIDYDIGFPGFANAALSGNVFMSKLRGTGTVWLQSVPGNKMIDLIAARVPTGNASKTGSAVDVADCLLSGS